MTIYWRQSDIPELKGLTLQERAVAKRAVLSKVWRHWQVWLPQVTNIAIFIIFIISVKITPLVMLISFPLIILFAIVAALPFNSYLQHYLANGSVGSN